ncbi:hypothetical protein ADUPG1_012816 [Aduncisulcus paluster]|uniref:Uncharacterized protein n=1 Tax=Aduncisulcus paluster TaxID=2918883 RepID=A0ABQ5K0T0_9EUKA|nr:hypothetical protein ADUPG1_012816 [Aduncisulcus paluster]
MTNANNDDIGIPISTSFQTQSRGMYQINNIENVSSGDHNPSFIDDFTRDGYIMFQTAMMYGRIVFASEFNALVIPMYDVDGHEFNQKNSSSLRIDIETDQTSPYSSVFIHNTSFADGKMLTIESKNWQEDSQKLVANFWPIVNGSGEVLFPDDATSSPSDDPCSLDSSDVVTSFDGRLSLVNDEDGYWQVTVCSPESSSLTTTQLYVSTVSTFLIDPNAIVLVADLLEYIEDDSTIHFIPVSDVDVSDYERKQFNDNYALVSYSRACSSYISGINMDVSDYISLNAKDGVTDDYPLRMTSAMQWYDKQILILNSDEKSGDIDHIVVTNSNWSPDGHFVLKQLNMDAELTISLVATANLLEEQDQEEEIVSDVGDSNFLASFQVGLLLYFTSENDAETVMFSNSVFANQSSVTSSLVNVLQHVTFDGNEELQSCLNDESLDIEFINRSKVSYGILFTCSLPQNFEMPSHMDVDGTFEMTSMFNHDVLPVHFSVYDISAFEKSPLSSTSVCGNLSARAPSFHPPTIPPSTPAEDSTNGWIILLWIGVPLILVSVAIILTFILVKRRTSTKKKANMQSGSANSDVPIPSMHVNPLATIISPSGLSGQLEKI